MIPKTIHYCWFGYTKKPLDIERSIESWKRVCPEFTIKEWNEGNFDVEGYPFTKKMYRERKWAFVADYVRLKVLEDVGGFYLDADMYLLQSLSLVSTPACVLGEEAPGTISAGMVGAVPHHPFIKACRAFYDQGLGELITIPRALTSVYNSYDQKGDILVLPPQAFYPFDQYNIKKFHGQDMGPNVYGVHLWNYSWGHPLNKFFKQIGIYSFGKRVTEILGIKKILKKLLKFI